jgi:hypothetical protein
MFIVQDWLKTYSYRRYGQSNVKIEKAWGVLYHTIYNCTDGIAVRFHADALLCCSCIVLSDIFIYPFHMLIAGS